MNSSRSLEIRVRILSAAIVLVTLLLVARLYMLQIVQGDTYRDKARGQYVESQKTSGDRYGIFFSPHNAPPLAAALVEKGWRLAIAPDLIRDPERTYETLSSIIDVDRTRFFAAAKKKGDPHEEIVARVSNEDADKIRFEKMPGILFVPDRWRVYPAHMLAAHTIGFVGHKGERREGVYGLEAAWEETLAKDTAGVAVNPFAEIFSNIGAAINFNPRESGGSLMLTLEPKVQEKLEEVIENIMKDTTPKVAAGIVMDPRTGEILAMAARPGFDPNTYNLVDDIGVFRNPLVENVYEMGSIVKPLTVAAAIDAGVVTPKTTYVDRGCVERSTKIICNHDKKARGTVSMQEVLSQSLNVGIAFILDVLPHQVFSEYMHAFGFGEKTGVDLPSEARGIIHSIEGGYDVDYVSAGFGQGIAVTGVQMTRALASLANGGVLVSPHVVRAVRLESGITRDIELPPAPRVITEETAATVSSMLVEVFDKALLKGELKQEHYSIAAKTGTAQIADASGGYAEGKYLHSFFGYFPAHDPRFLVFLMAEEPHGAEFASATLARPFLQLTQYLIRYYEVPPDR
jgi:cell division protein FtsI/penicillin-binding protein 2